MDLEKLKACADSVADLSSRMDAHMGGRADADEEKTVSSLRAKIRSGDWSIGPGDSMQNIAPGATISVLDNTRGGKKLSVKVAG